MKRSRDSAIWKKAMDEFCATTGITNEKPDGPRDTSWRELIRRGLMALFASYRPELHYMRGPGPKWREKHSRRLAKLTDWDALSSGPLSAQPALWWPSLGRAIQPTNSQHFMRFKSHVWVHCPFDLLRSHGGHLLELTWNPRVTFQRSEKALGPVFDIVM
jgi:hypothetical protein